VIDTVTGSKWEGSGVIPDVACTAAEAWEVALARSVFDRPSTTGR
jgi:hypothetical protein